MVKKIHLPHRIRRHIKLFMAGSAYLCTITSLTVMWGLTEKASYYATQSQTLWAEAQDLRTTLDTEKENSASLSASLSAYLTDDQYVRNESLNQTIKNITSTYTQASKTYEDLLDLKVTVKDTKKLDELYAEILLLLSQQNYATASDKLKTLAANITAEEQKAAESFAIPANVPVNNAPPNSGYQRQQVQTDIGTFLVNIVTADLNSTRVIVDTASDSDCANDCPVLALGDYVARNGAFAGINGSYFCPATYPTCADRKNSFDTLLMNKNKKYFNSDNNVYSNVPAVIFSGNSARFVGRSLEWGRDTGVDAVLANQALLVSGGNVVFGGDGDPKKGSKGPRSFVGATGSTVYIGVVSNATVAEAAHVLKALGIQNGLNLDGGRSSALWSNGYKVGPGRALPNVLLFVRR